MSRRKQAKPRSLKPEEEGWDEEGRVGSEEDSDVDDEGEELANDDVSDDNDDEDEEDKVDDAEESHVRDAFEDSGEAEENRMETSDRWDTEMPDGVDIKSEDADSMESEALGSVGSTAGSSWPSSTPEPSPSPTTDAAEPADADAEPPFTLGATEHTPYQCQFCDKAFPRLSYLKKHEQESLDGRAILKEGKGGLLTEGSRRKLSQLLIHQKLENNCAKKISSEEFYKLATEIVEIFHKESVVVYYSAYLSATNKIAKKNASGKLYESYIARRRKLRESGLLPGTSRSSSKSSGSSLRSTPTIADEDLHNLESLESGIVYEETLLWLKNNVDPWQSVEEKWAETADHRLNRIQCGKGEIADYFKDFPALKQSQGYTLTHSDQMPFRCEFCSRHFKHKRSRDRHVKLHTGDRKYRCPHCESAFSRSDHLKIHMKTHDIQKPFQCTVCNRGYNTAAALTSHMQGHKRDREGRETDRRRALRCPRCGDAFRRTDLLQAHMTSAHGVDAAALTPPRRVASQPPPTLLACIYCTRDTFTSMEQLQLHVRAAHSALLNGETPPDQSVEQPAPTDLSRRAEEPSVKRRRSDSATPQLALSPGTLLCNQCDAALPDFEAFRAHLKGHLEEVGELNRTSPTPCPHCGASFADAAASERHLAAHYLAVSCEYTCHSCARSFPTPDDLQKHLLDLHAHHLYRCSLCKEIFDSKVAIQVHFAVAHSGESKVWVCRSCGGSPLRSEAEGAAHVRARHSAARCACGAVLAGARALRAHAQLHAYRCPAPGCAESFAVQYLLERHMQAHHAVSHQGLNGDSTRAKRIENNNSGDGADGACSPCAGGETGGGDERRRKNGAVALQCAYCGERTRSRAELEAHTRAHSGAAAARHKCLICDEILPSAAVLAEHKLTHCKVVAGDTCARCRARLPSEESFLSHMARHHPALPAPCVVCRQTLASEAEARLHARFHLRCSGDEQRCAICLRTLPDGEAGSGARACAACYARHAAPRAPPPADHDCRLCRRTLGSPTRLQAHLIEHTFAGIGAFTCYLCSAVFTSAAGLQRHLPEHASAPRPYDCARCGLKFFFRAELDNHSFVHLEEAEIAQRAFYEAYARGAASAWAALAPPEPAPTPAAEPDAAVKREPEIKEEKTDEYIEVGSPPPPPPPSPPQAEPVVKQEKPDED